MKKILTPFLAILMLAFAGQTFAHEHHHDNSVKVSASDSLMQIEMAKHQQMEAVSVFPNYHPLVIHFPIVLLLMSAVFQLLSFFFYKKEFSIVTLILLLLGVISAWLASNTFHAMPGELTGKAKEIFDTHEQMASLTWWFSLVASFVKTASHFFLDRKGWIETAVALLLIASGITVSIAGHHGAMLVHMEGIGPQGKYLESYKLPETTVDTASHAIKTEQTENDKEESQGGEQEEDHHVGEIGKGPHGGTIEEADPYHMEIVSEGNDLVFYLLDGDAKSLDMKDVTGSVKMEYTDKSKNTINLMTMDGKLTAMQAQKGKSFTTAICTLAKGGKSFSASFSSKDLRVINNHPNS
jgi:uncharacterized membrane protein